MQKLGVGRVAVVDPVAYNLCASQTKRLFVVHVTTSYTFTAFSC